MSFFFIALYMSTTRFGAKFAIALVAPGEPARRPK